MVSYEIVLRDAFCIQDRVLAVVAPLRTVAVQAQTDKSGAVQLGPAATQRFEVASVRRCTDDLGPLARGGGARFSPGRMTLNCQTVSGLIQAAYVMAITAAQANAVRKSLATQSAKSTNRIAKAS